MNSLPQIIDDKDYRGPVVSEIGRVKDFDGKVLNDKYNKINGVKVPHNDYRRALNIIKEILTPEILIFELAEGIKSAVYITPDHRNDFIDGEIISYNNKGELI